MPDHVQGAGWLRRTDAEREELLAEVRAAAVVESQRAEALLNALIAKLDMPFTIELHVLFKPISAGKLLSNALVETARSLNQEERFVLEWLSKEDSGGAFGECNGKSLDRLLSLGLAQIGPEDSRGKLYRRVTLTDLGHGVLAFAAPSEHRFAGDAGAAQ